MTRHACAWIVTVSLACAAGVPLQTPARAAGASQAPADADLAEARRLFEALDYEHAAPLLDRAIAALEASAATPGSRSALVSAYEMRARTRFGLGDSDGAAADFRALLGIEPGFAWSGQISPRVVALFEEVKKATIGTLALTLEPGDATLSLNGQPVTLTPAGLTLTAGDYTVSAARVGYRPLEQQVTVKAGETTPVAIALERTSAAVFLATSPADVEVLVDGHSRGRTVAAAGAAADAVSESLVLTDLSAGSHELQFRRDCYATERRPLAIEDPRDYRIEAVRLQPAVATLVIESTPAGASVFVDDQPRGTTPATIGGVCEGPRVIDLRGVEGRALRRVEAKAGERITIDARLKPAFVLLPSGAGIVSAAGTTDIRTIVERAMSPAAQAMVFVPAGRRLEEALDAQAMPPEWLAFDAGRRPVGGAATVSPTARRELSERIAKALDVQGVAAITQPNPTSPELVIALLAAGAGEPDVVTLRPENIDSVKEAIERFDYVPALAGGTIGVLAVEAADLTGLAVARVEPGGPGDQAGIKPGDILVQADGQPLERGAMLARLLDEHRGRSVQFEVKDPAGASRSVTVPVALGPRLVSVADQSLLFNLLAVALRARVAAATMDEQPYVRLNLAVALMRLGDFQGAREQLEAVQLPAGRGISQGTQQYLLGLALEGLGDSAGASRAWQAAAASEASLTEVGPPVKGLAERRLGPSGGGRPPSAH